jgi:tetratricopeptide (TPR) repeat protein
MSRISVPTALFAVAIAFASICPMVACADSKESKDNKDKDQDQIMASPDVAKILTAAQKLIAANDFRTAMDQLRAAQALPKNTPEDNFLINEFLASVAVRQNDITTATTSFEAMADSPLLAKDPKKVEILFNAMVVDDVAKRYQKVIAYGKMLEAIQPLDDKQLAALAEAYYFTNDYADVRAIAQKAMAAAKAAGALPPQNVLQMLYNADIKGGDKTGAATVSEELALDYNSPQDWSQTIDIALSSAKGTDIEHLDILRLGVAAGANLDTSDYNLMGQIAMHRAFFGDAALAANHGGKVPGATAKAASDQKSLPGLVAAAKGQDAQHSIVLAEDLYGYGRYAESEELARQALAKGGAAGEANLLIGMSLAGQGKYADAATTFKSVSGGPLTMKAAQLWQAYAEHKAMPPAAATTAPGGSSAPASH